MSVKHNKSLLCFFIALGQHVSILIESSSGPSKKIDPYLEMLKCAVGSLEGPEDDSVRIETCCPNAIKKNTTKVCCV